MLAAVPEISNQGFRQGWRLAVPLFAILAIVFAAGSLLIAGQVFEHNRQEQRLIADTLWAEQAVSYEVTRMIDGIRSLGRPFELPGSGHGSDLDARISSVMQRDPAIQSIRIWTLHASEPAPPGSEDRAALETRIRDVASRASRLREAATLELPGPAPESTRLIIAVPISGDDGLVGVAVVSLQRLLQNTIPWWLAHVSEITLEDSAGVVLARRDGNVRGLGLYRHKIVTTFVDRSLYLSANSSQGAPMLIPNLQALAIACLSLLLAWTVYALWRDLGKRTRAEFTLRAQHALQKAMENALVTGLCARDMQGRISYANPAFCDMVGRSIGDLFEMEPTTLGLALPPDLGPAHHEEPRPDTASSGVVESRLVRPDGVSIDVQLHEAPLLDGSGRQIGWMASVQDVSEQKRSAELLRIQADRIQKMARLMTMGEMASALAHELNQPLAAATSYLTAGLNVLGECPAGRAPDPAAHEYFGKARKQTQRAGEIIKRVRQFVGHSMPALNGLHVHAVLRDLLPLIKLQAIESGASIVTTFDKHLPAVLADRVLLEQIILNLTKNAIEAVSHLATPHRRVEVFATAAGDGVSGAVVVGVRDRGPGLGDDSARILASPLTSTKPGGMGMGLAVCRKAAQLLGTQLEYLDRPGGGADFHFTLREFTEVVTLTQVQRPEVSKV